MRLQILLVWCLVGFSHSAWAQIAARRDTVVGYLDSDFLPVSGLKEAVYRTKAVPTDSLGGVVFTYSLDGWLVERQEFAKLRPRVGQGLDELYYPQSKQLKVVCHFKQGKLDGELLSYYPSGRLKRREQYKEFLSQGGQCFDEVGEPMAFVPYMVLPEFRGGIAGLMRFISSNLKYPRTALLSGLQSRVFVTFIVDEQGKVKNARVVEPGYPALDNEALRVVNLLKKWKPGRKEGEIKEVSFTLPVTFRIQ